MVTYEDLGVSPVINAWGTVTKVGGSLMPQPALVAMVEAGREYVVLDELYRAAGRFIAKRLGVEAACVCAGASAGMALAAAACMAGTDPAKRAQLPETDGMKNEIIMLRTMRSRYDQAFRVAGAKIVEVGLPKRTEVWELQAAIGPQTAAVAYLVEHEGPGGLALEVVVSTAHQHGLPVIVDAAAELPPVENLSRFSKAGVDLTIFSGGKDICGPQTTGLIVGRPPLIDACLFNASPNHSVGRSMKVGKEELMGFLTALDIYLEQDFDAEMEAWEGQVGAVVAELSELDGIRAYRVFPAQPGIQPTCIPRAHIEWTEALSPLAPEEAQARLLEGVPRVAVGTTAGGIVVNPQMLRPGEETVVAEAIKRVLLSGEEGDERSGI